MNGRKRLGLFLAVAGVLVLAASGVLWKRSAPNIEKMRVESAALEDSVKKIHAELVHQSLLLQGLNASMSTVPDSVRRYGAGQMMATSSSYNKVIRKLEMKERDINLDIASLHRDSERERAGARSRTLPVAAAGVAALLVGLMMTAIPARRVGA
jgi:glutamate mutase epsilon subunit